MQNNFTITIVHTIAPESIAALRGILSPSAAPAQQAPTPPPIPAAPAAAPPVQQPAPPAIPTGAPAVPQAPPPTAAIPTGEPAYTLEQLSQAAALFAETEENRQKVMGLFGQFGVQMMTQLKPEQYGAFATALRQLGAKI